MIGLDISVGIGGGGALQVSHPWRRWRFSGGKSGLGISGSGDGIQGLGFGRCKGDDCMRSSV